MAEKEKTSNAVEILHRRYIKNDPQRMASLQTERVNAEVAQLIHDLRKDAGLTQSELAERIGTTQSVISRLEDAEYEGHSLSMLHRVADALRQKLTLTMTSGDPEAGPMHYAFRLFVQMLRRRRGLTVDDVARQAGLPRDEVISLERTPGGRPTVEAIHRLSELYDVPESKLMALAGIVKDVPDPIRSQASRFVARSESFVKLTREERQAVDEFLGVLKDDAEA